MTYEIYNTQLSKYGNSSRLYLSCHSVTVPDMADFGGQMTKEYSEECSTHPATNGELPA